MSTAEQMTIDEIYKYLRKMRPLYQKASKKEKSKLLDEMETITGRHRKYICTLLQGRLKRRPRKRQRTRTYQADFDRILRIIYESYDHICAERLHPNLKQLAEQLASHGELTLNDKLKAQLTKVSLSTVRDRLRQYRQDEPRITRGPRRSPHPFLQDIPMRRLPWNIDRPGYFEVDLVHHCGSSLHGEYVYTLQMIDVYSGWSERVSLLGRSLRVMAHGFERILERLPFPIHAVHPDNGSEFFNHHMLNFWSAYPHVELSRSRPYRKNDNRFVEQKNSSLVRAYVGDIRLDTVDQARALDNIYRRLWLFNNCFQPSLRLSAKSAVLADDGQFSHVRRSFSALTSWQRLCYAGVLSPTQQDLIQLRIDVTNPRLLRSQIYADLDALFRLPSKVSDHPEDVFATLSNSSTFS